MKLAIPLALAALLVACASTASYGPASGSGAYGYTDSKLEDDRYRVQYRLRGENVGRAQDLVLLRAADLTIANGHNWFRVINRSSDVAHRNDDSARATFGMERTVTRDCGLLGCRTTSVPSYGAESTVGTIERGSTVVVIEILTGSGEKPDDVDAYNASEIASNIRSRM